MGHEEAWCAHVSTTVEDREDTLPTVLVVEDDKRLLELIAVVLSEETHCRVLEASTGAQALAITVNDHPQLVLLDYRLSGKMNGLELYDQLHARDTRATIQAIVVSANVPELQHELQARHLVGIAKPFDLDELLDSVQAALHASLGEGCSLAR
jgi:DNA-binding response OmpR family regulator